MKSRRLYLTKGNLLGAYKFFDGKPSAIFDNKMTKVFYHNNLKSNNVLTCYGMDRLFPNLWPSEKSAGFILVDIIETSDGYLIKPIKES